MENEKNHHFVLVHGGCHGAWCWYKVVTILTSQGHKVSALDMAASGINPKSIQQVNSWEEYTEPLLLFMASLPSQERVILVGHSMGGFNISLAMEKFPEKISVAVFVTAFMPGPDGPDLSIFAIDQQHNEQVESHLDAKLEFSKGMEKGPTSLLLGPKQLAANFYQMSPPQDLTLATLLVRPAPLFEESSDALTNEKYGSVRRAYIVCGKDNVLKEEQFQRWMIKNNPPDVVELISDADHMVMFSKPQELCSCLVLISEKFH